MVALSDYELLREQNIQKNKDLLQALGIESIQIASKPPRSPNKKRKAVDQSTDFESPKKSSKKSYTEKPAANINSESLRRSLRNAGKVVDYKSERHELPSVNLKGHLPRISQPRVATHRKYDPKRFGHIPGVEVGAWWETRELCSLDSIHAPWVAGISGSSEGCYSIALSGGYEDDVDLGYAFTYTGSGGRDLKGTKGKPKNLRTAPQSSDQSFEHHFNKALKISSEKKKPVRVIRGYKSSSQWAPLEGFRYDGLYTVEKAWMEMGLNPKGYLVCKFALKRLPDQPPIPKRVVPTETEELAMASEPEDEEETNSESTATNTEEDPRIDETNEDNDDDTLNSGSNATDEE